MNTHLRSALALLFALTACDSGKVCEPNALQCSPLKNRVEQCNADGTAAEVVGQCPGNTCIEANGTAQCEGAGPVCTAGEARCSELKNRVEVCNAAGSAFETSATCQGNTCVVEGGVPTCKDEGPGPLCTPGETRCSELKNRVEVCNAEGSAYETTATCPGNTCIVEAGTARCDGPEAFCTPGEARCSELRNRVEVCNAAGSAFETTAACPGNTCIVDNGTPRCDGPEAVCVPGESRCGEAPNQVERCATDGSAWVAGETCQGLLECVVTGSGTAGCQACVPDSRRCTFNGDVLEVCNAAGTAYEAGQSCLFNSCDFIDGDYRCELPCTPGERRCANNNFLVQVCNAAGDAFTPFERCLEGSCTGEGGVATCGVPEVCPPGARRCSAIVPNVIEECDLGGTGWYGDETCPGLTECIVNGSGAAVCQACVPGSRRCTFNKDALEICNAAGTAYERAETCLFSSCDYLDGDYRCELPCIPGETRCANNNAVAEVCNAAGTDFEVFETCVQLSCTTAAGPASCTKPRICTPGERRCSANADNQIEQCNAEGSGWYLQNTCAGALECVSGACQLCVPGSLMCGANNASVQVCNATGTAFTPAESCASNSCKNQNGVVDCELPCTPGQRRCSALRNRVEVCDASGTSYSTLETCSGNTCGLTDTGAVCNSTSVCTPGARRCSTTDPSKIEQCNTTGTGWYAATTCYGGLACTTATGSASCQPCMPGTLRCGANNGTVEQCNAAGTTFETVDTCLAGSCRLVDGVSACDLPCTPGATRCSATGSQVQVCSPAGDAWNVSEGCVDLSCTTEGDLAFCEQPQVCTPNARRCSDSAPNAVEQCTARGDGWVTATTCAGALQCTLTAAGTEGCQVCVPGTRYCGSNNASVMECNAQGTAFVKAEDCLDNTCRYRDGAIACDLPCAPGSRRCSPLKNRVEECATDGKSVTTVATCSGNSCTAAFGTATCEAPPVECEAGESRCNATATAVEVCSDAGEYETTATCPAADCRVLNGVAACAAPECTPGRYFCEDGDVHACTSQGKDGGVKQDCAATDTCRVLDGVAQCVPAEVPMSCEPNLQFCEGSAIYYCNSLGQVSGLRTTCSDGEICVVDAYAPICLGGSYEEGPSGEQTCVVTEPATCVIIPKAFTTRGFVYAESEKLSCDAPARDYRECGEQMACLDGHCTSSVSDESSPYYPYSCPLDQHLAYPTDLPADCRCFINNSTVTGVDLCGRPYDRAAQGVRVGTGPSLFGLSNAHYSGGFVEGNELIVAAYWGSSTAPRGAILAVHVDTGDRRLVSGDLGATTVGSGPALPYALDVRKGADGKYYALGQSTSPGAPSIFRVEPATGARTLVWRGQDASFGQCAAGDPTAASRGLYVQYTNNGFAVDASGAFLLGYANAQRDGRGLVRISANGSTCTYVAATGARADGLTRGAGPDLGGFVQGFMVDGNKVLVHITQPKALVEIDLTTGDRVALFASGTAGSIGERWAIKDPARGLIWTAGLMNSVTIVGYDRARNKLLDVFSSCGDASFPWYPLCPGAGPVKINSLNYGGIWLHPRTGNLLLAQDSISIIEFEPETANSIIRSL